MVEKRGKNQNRDKDLGEDDDFNETIQGLQKLARKVGQVVDFLAEIKAGRDFDPDLFDSKLADLIDEIEVQQEQVLKAAKSELEENSGEWQHNLFILIETN